MIGIKKYMKYFLETLLFYKNLNKGVGSYCDDDQSLATVSLLFNSGKNNF